MFACSQAGAQPEATGPDDERERSLPIPPAPGVEDTERTVTVVAPEGHPSLPLLHAELRALGLSIRERLPTDPPLESAFRVVVSEGNIEVWVRDRQTQRIERREIFTQSDTSPVERLTAVLHVVELLRTEQLAPEPKVEPPEPPPRVAPQPRTTRSRWVLSAGPQATYSPGGTTVGGGAELDVVHYWSSIGVRGYLATTVIPNRQAAREGVAEAAPHFGGVQFVFGVDRDRAPLVASAGAGVALLGTRITATANAGYRSVDDRLLTVSPIVDLRLGAPVGDHLALVATGALLTPLRSDRMLFGDRVVARHGAAIITTGLGVEVSLPR